MEFLNHYSLTSFISKLFNISIVKAKLNECYLWKKTRYICCGNRTFRTTGCEHFATRMHIIFVISLAHPYGPILVCFELQNLFLPPHIGPSCVLSSSWSVNKYMFSNLSPGVGIERLLHLSFCTLVSFEVALFFKALSILLSFSVAPLHSCCFSYKCHMYNHKFFLVFLIIWHYGVLINCV